MFREGPGAKLGRNTQKYLEHRELQTGDQGAELKQHEHQGLMDTGGPSSATWVNCRPEASYLTSVTLSILVAK